MSIEKHKKKIRSRVVDMLAAQAGRALDAIENVIAHAFDGGELRLIRQTVERKLERVIALYDLAKEFDNFEHTWPKIDDRIAAVEAWLKKHQTPAKVRST